MLFVLQPCKVREMRLVPIKGAEPISLDWEGLRDLIVPAVASDASRAVQQRHRRHLAKLRLLQPGCYVGRMTSRVTNSDTPFLMLNLDRSNDLRYHIKKDPLLVARLQSSYRVLHVDWGDAARPPLEYVV